MLLELFTIAMAVAAVFVLSLTLHKMNKKKEGLKINKVCGDKYVVAQQACLRDNPLAGCDKRFVSDREYDEWADKAQKCIDKVHKECHANCRPEDCPGCLDTRSRY